MWSCSRKNHVERKKEKTSRAIILQCERIVQMVQGFQSFHNFISGMKQRQDLPYLKATLCLKAKEHVSPTRLSIIMINDIT